MKTTLTAEHVQRAIDTYKTCPDSLICQSCPIYQALKDDGLDVKEVALDTFETKNGDIFRINWFGQEVTCEASSNWKDLIPKCPIEFSYHFIENKQNR